MRSWTGHRLVRLCMSWTGAPSGLALLESDRTLSGLALQSHAELLAISDIVFALALQNVYRTMQHWKGQSSALLVGDFARRFLLLYKQLSYETAAWENQWIIYPKHHMFLHISEDQIQVSDNPAHSWTYDDESAIGECVKICQKANARFIHRAVLKKHHLLY